MKMNLSVIERYLLETLSKGVKSFSQLNEETKVDYALLNNILSKLMMENIVSYRTGRYFLNPETQELWLPLINSSESLTEEIKELFSTLVSDYFSNEENVSLKVQKLSMTEHEEKIFNSYLINLEKFIEDVKKERKKNPFQGKLKEQKVVVWGCADYGRLVQNTLKAV